MEADLCRMHDLTTSNRDRIIHAAHQVHTAVAVLLGLGGTELALVRFRLASAQV